MTNFTDVSAFNEFIGNAQGTATVDQIKKQMQLIRSEFEELESGVIALAIAAESLADATNHDIETAQEWRDSALIEIRDGIADVLVTTYGLAHRMGIDADKDMLTVSASNASKFFTGDEHEAAEVCKALADTLGINVEAREATNLAQGEEGEAARISVWAFVSADDNDPERPRGKLLKAPGYKPPVFD